MSLLSAFTHLLGGKRQEVWGAMGKPTKHPELTPEQVQEYNAQMEQEGARAFNQAHPGQVYQTNQNGEFGAGELPAPYSDGAPIITGYRQPKPPILLRGSTLNARHRAPQQPSFTAPVNQGVISLQGDYNPGRILLQSGNRPLNPQVNSLYYSGDY